MTSNPAVSKPALKTPVNPHSGIVSAAMTGDEPEESAASYAARGDEILNYCEKTESKTERDEYLIAAKYFYYQANKIDHSNRAALIGRARIALMQNQITDAKNNLFTALNFDENNPKVNFYLGEAFFQNGEYTKAVKYYSNAHKHGYRLDYKTNIKLGICYEKLDDTANAGYYYNNAIRIEPAQSEAKMRLQGLYIINTSASDDYEASRKELEIKQQKNFEEEIIDEELMKNLFH